MVPPPVCIGKCSLLYSNLLKKPFKSERMEVHHVIFLLAKGKKADAAVHLFATA